MVRERSTISTATTGGRSDGQPQCLEAIVEAPGVVPNLLAALRFVADDTQRFPGRGDNRGGGRGGENIGLDTEADGLQLFVSTHAETADRTQAFTESAYGKIHIRFNTRSLGRTTTTVTQHTH